MQAAAQVRQGAIEDAARLGVDSEEALELSLKNGTSSLTELNNVVKIKRDEAIQNLAFGTSNRIDEGKKAKLESLSNQELGALKSINDVSPELGEQLVDASPAVRELFFRDVENARGDNIIGHIVGGTIGAFYDEETITRLYLAKLSDEAGESQGSLDDALASASISVATTAQDRRTAADERAKQLELNGTPQIIIDAFLFYEYSGAASDETIQSGLLGIIKTTRDFAEAPELLTERVITGGVQTAGDILTDETAALQYLENARQGVEDFAAADIRDQATAVGNGVGNITLLAAEVATGTVAARALTKLAPGAKTPDANISNNTDPASGTEGRANDFNTDGEAGGGVSFLPEWRNPDGSWRYPGEADGFPNGFATPPVDETLAVGTQIDRYGEPSGRFLAPEGTPFGNRSIPPTHRAESLYVYEIVRPLPVQSGPAAPWFGFPGGGTQYYTGGRTINDLIRDGFIKCVKGPRC